MLRDYVFQLRDILMPYKRMRPMMQYIQRHNNGDGLVGVEIGVQNGIHARSILENLLIKKLYLVDPYQHYEVYGTEDGRDTWAVGYSQLDFDIMFNTTQYFLRKYRNVEFVRLMSKEASDVVPGGLDFVYIDGNHSYGFVMEDMALWYPKIKSGGFIGGHDYNYTQPGVVRAVNDWTIKNGMSLMFHGSDWWINVN